MKKDYQYKTKGICSREISFAYEDGIVKNVEFVGGCEGNTSGIAALVDGMEAEKIVQKCKGIHCGRKSTSCPDQLACAIEQAMKE